MGTMKTENQNEELILLMEEGDPIGQAEKDGNILKDVKEQTAGGKDTELLLRIDGKLDALLAALDKGGNGRERSLI